MGGPRQFYFLSYCCRQQNQWSALLPRLFSVSVVYSGVRQKRVGFPHPEGGRH